MAQFSIKKNNVDSVIDAERKLAGELSSLENEIRSVGNSLGFQLAAKTNIRNRLNSAANSVSAHRSAMNNMRSALSDTLKTYESTENTILGRKSGIFSVFTKISGPQWEGDVIEKLHDSDLSDDNPLKKAADKLHDFNEKHKKTKTKIKGYYDEDGNFHDVTNMDKDSDEYKKYEELSSLEQEATLASVGVGVSGSLWDVGGEVSRGPASASFNASAFNAKAEAEAYAGLYSYDKNGKKQFTPGFGGKAGVGVSAFTAEAKGTLGDEYFNLHAGGSAEFLAASAEAEANIGLFDKDGKLNPKISAGVSAEAVLAEVSGTVGATIVGTEINATAGVKVGVGAHADIGLRDGKLSVDVGAALGVGVSVKFDVDFSGTVDAIGDKISSGWSEFCGWFKG